MNYQPPSNTMPSISYGTNTLTTNNYSNPPPIATYDSNVMNNNDSGHYEPSQLSLTTNTANHNNYNFNFNFNNYNNYNSNNDYITTRGISNSMPDQYDDQSHNYADDNRNDYNIMPGIPSIPSIPSIGSLTSFDETPTNTKNSMCYFGVANEQPQQLQVNNYDYDQHVQEQEQGQQQNNFCYEPIVVQQPQQHVQQQQHAQQHVEQQQDLKLFSLTSNNSNHPFIKPSNFIYPTYKQKYVANNAYASSRYNIKNELYRHRKEIKEIKEIKIKGSNFESLVKKLTAFGDNTHCIECQRFFYEKCQLFGHIRDMHLIRSTVHSCPFCIKTFHQKSNLDTHCMTHAKDRKFSHPFKCIICIKQGKDKCFTRKSSLKRHCQTKHKNVNLECEWINKQQTPKWNHKLKTFVFNPVKNKININISNITANNYNKKTFKYL